MRSLKVLEVGQYAAGYAGRLFVRDGADVVRVECADATGDPNPAWASDEAMALYLHAGKRRITLSNDALLADLAGTADVVICEGGSADDIQQLGFTHWQGQRADYAKVAITPFGLTGPKRNWQATPNVLLAMGGYTQLMGDADREPLSLPGHYVEFQSGTLAYAAANAVLYDSHRNSAEVSMLETLMSLSQFTTVRWHCAEEIRSRHGSDFWFVSPSDLFRLRDGWVYINIVSQFWDSFTVLLGKPELLLDVRYENNDLRMQNREPLYAVIGEAFANMTRAQVEQAAATCRVPLGVVRTLDDVLAEPHLSARQFWETLHNVDAGTVRGPGIPYRLQPGVRTSQALSPVQAPVDAVAGDTWHGVIGDGE